MSMPPMATKKVAEHLDEETNPAFQKMTWFKLGPLKMNPIVSGIAAVIIWGFVIWCMVDDDAGTELSSWKTWVADSWSWFYIVSQDIWVVALIYILFTKYKNLKLGKDDEKPEFSDMTWFAMMFSAGVAVGIFYYSVAEPMWHYNGWGGARWLNEDDNTKGTHAMMVTWYHWGLHGWIPYTVVGAVLGLMSYRRGLPMTLRFCFYPLIGDRVYGWIGDLVDISSIVCTLFGVCTSLGLGVAQINAGLERLDKGTFKGEQSHPDGRVGIARNTDTQVAIIWIITALATVSVVSGLKYGIRRISQVCFSLGMFLMLTVFFLGNTEYILNLIVQTFGYYLWYLPRISFHTDAFELTGQVPVGCTDTVHNILGADGESIIGTYTEAGDHCGGSGWMDSWTIFYWGWWISWGPFVGMFMAKISRGRTLGQFILGTLILPSAYSFIWLGIFGAEGIFMDRQAAVEGLNCGDPADIFGHFNNPDSNSVRLWCLSTEDVFFDQITSYGGQGFGDFLSIISIVTLVLYFITSSDSGSLVIDIIAANGIGEPPVVQKIFWAFSEGAAATALLVAGGSDALRALQTASIVCGLPYTFVLFWITQSLLLAVKEEAGDLDPERKSLRSFLFSFDFKNQGMFSSLGDILVATFAPFLTMASAQGKVMAKQGYDMITLVGAGLMWVATLMFIILKVQDDGFMMVSASMYVLLCCWMGWIRRSMRVAVGCDRGNYFTDVLSCLCFYFLALPQMDAEMDTVTASVASDGSVVYNDVTVEKAL